VSAPVVTFLTDYGRDDEFVGVCHGVIARRCPQARVIDLSHGIPPQDVVAGALALARALPYTPAGVYLAVVDPGVGGARRAVALRAADGRLFVGPDNGLLWPAAQAAGGVAAAVDLAGSAHLLEPVSATFHGRDVFAPVAASLAAGTPLHAVGTPLDVASLETLEIPAPRHDGGALLATALAVDHFGNVALNATRADLPSAATAWLAGDRPATLGRIFTDVAPGELLLYEDSSGTLALAVNRGSAAERLGVEPGATVRLAAR
jgi:hypothetical protein